MRSNDVWRPPDYFSVFRRLQGEWKTLPSCRTWSKQPNPPSEPDPSIFVASASTTAGPCTSCLFFARFFVLLFLLLAPLVLPLFCLRVWDRGCMESDGYLRCPADKIMALSVVFRTTWETWRSILNGHIGSAMDGYAEVHGGFSFGARNEEGRAILEFATAHDLVVANSFFKKREAHLITSRSGVTKPNLDVGNLGCSFRETTTQEGGDREGEDSMENLEGRYGRDLLRLQYQ
ncbi:hypothetical protein Tco_0995133 [Tanacetum coccineum]